MKIGKRYEYLKINIIAFFCPIVFNFGYIPKHMHTSKEVFIFAKCFPMVVTELKLLSRKPFSKHFYNGRNRSYLFGKNLIAFVGKHGA